MGNGKKVSGDPPSNRCTALNSKGEPCGAYALKGKKRCFHHSTSTRVRRKATEARQRGGRVTKGLHDVLQAELAAAKIQAQKRLALARASLGVDDFDDLISLCAERIAQVPYQYEAQWAYLLARCMERTEGQNVVHHIEYADPLGPEDEAPPLPALPGVGADGGT